MTSSPYRSGLEERIAAQLEKDGIPFLYEAYTFDYFKPLRDTFTELVELINPFLPKKFEPTQDSVWRKHHYTPDFHLPSSAILVEAKGRFLSTERTKHLFVKKTRPDLNIRFVFSNSKQRIAKNSTTTYGEWCAKHGFKYADKLIPKDWY